MEFLNRTLFSLFDDPPTGAQLLWALTWLLAGAVAAFAATAALARRLIWPGTGRSKAAQAILSAIRIKIFAAGVLAAVAALGANVVPLVFIILTVAGVAAISLRQTAAQLWAGFMLLWERPMALGEKIAVGEFAGEVIEVGLRATVLRSDEGLELTVPNSYLTENAIANWSHLEGGARICIPLEVTADADSSRVITALRKAAERNNRVLKSPTPKAFMVGFGERGLKFELRAWVDNHSEVIWATNELCRAAESELKKSGLNIAVAGDSVAVPSDRPSRSHGRSSSGERRSSPDAGNPRRRRDDEDVPDLLSEAGIPEDSEDTVVVRVEPPAPKPRSRRARAPREEAVQPEPKEESQLQPPPQTEPERLTEPQAEPERLPEPPTEPEPQPQPEPAAAELQVVMAPESKPDSEGEGETEQPATPAYGRSKRRVMRK
jgi:small-conductance mechanosensitive channel